MFDNKNIFFPDTVKKIFINKILMLQNGKYTKRQRERKKVLYAKKRSLSRRKPESSQEEADANAKRANGAECEECIKSYFSREQEYVTCIMGKSLFDSEEKKK